jgi:hypothetical protein
MNCTVNRQPSTSKQNPPKPAKTITTATAWRSRHPLENENKNFIVKAKETKFRCRPRRRRQLVFVVRRSSFVSLGAA